MHATTNVKPMTDPEEQEDGPMPSLVCQGCARSVPCTRLELLEYLKFGWPRCCDETMTVAIEAPAPRGNES